MRRSPTQLPLKQLPVATLMFCVTTNCSACRPAYCCKYKSMDAEGCCCESLGAVGAAECTPNTCAQQQVAWHHSMRSVVSTSSSGSRHLSSERVSTRKQAIGSSWSTCRNTRVCKMLHGVLHCWQAADFCVHMYCEDACNAAHLRLLGHSAHASCKTPC